MGMEISAGDLMTMRKLKNTDATSHLHIDQHNMPSAALISVVKNKQSRCSSGLGDLLTTQAQNSFTIFWVLKNGANTSNLTSANFSKSHCMIHFNTLLP